MLSELESLVRMDFHHVLKTKRGNTFNSGETKPISTISQENSDVFSQCIFFPPYLKQPEPSTVVLGVGRLRKNGNRYSLLYLLVLVEFMRQKQSIIVVKR